ncbi:MAG: type II CRISPR RNA-guided endonuclease Cas9 [Lachnospiraceae bacterium]|nr:type II CRISPR RNA-guided endonuclease Cas9 [Lachnospiraceae bacterium]
MDKQKYYLGLDMGTSSVGWAVTDGQYNILRKKGKDLWGVREFEEAKTAVERRTNRVSRRRRQREVVRIGMLKDFFQEEINKVDPNFYQRLENSKYWLEDKDEEVKTPNGLFNDKNYKDKDYFKQYPTVFHLRKELIINSEPHDVRLVYLALLNMFKHRGHFLNASLGSDDNGQSMQEALYIMASSLEEVAGICLPSIDPSKLEEILSNRDYSRTRKKETIAELINIQKGQKKELECIQAICGLKIDAKKIFEELEEKVEICFSDFGFEDKIPEIIEKLGDERFSVIQALKEIYDLGTLAGIMKGSQYLSEARVKEYEKHAKDLQILKAVIKKYKSKEEYNKMFRESEAGSYSAYVNSFNAGKKQRRNFGTGAPRKRETFYAYVKKQLKDLPETDEQVLYILDEISKETFMPKQLTASNGVIPNQVHLKEMKKILSNAETYLPFLKEKDESNLTISERIIALFSFQIPYYIGPTSENSKKNNGNGWVVRKEEGAVLPWNYEDKIDVKATAEAFISRMVRRCTFISGEQVLPKCSLEYEAYCVLNEINNLKINDEKISVELKQKIYVDLFEKGKKVTRNQLEKYLVGCGALTENDKLTGIDININNSLSSYGKFLKIFGDDMKKDTYKKMAEDIIFWSTLYGDSKAFLKAQIKEHYPELSEENLKLVLGLKFKDWGNLSKELLELPGCEKGIGEKLSLIRALWETNNNFMELLYSPDFTFKEELEERQNQMKKGLSDFDLDDLNDWYFSAPVKKMIWQTIKIIKEIEYVMGHAPEKVFIEMTRSDEQKGDLGRKNSREKQLIELYKNIKDETHLWKEEIEKAGASGTIKSKKMYLYFLQMGRDMYTGQPIDLDDLFNDNLYDIDHIYPRHFVKDDNINNNLVLVNKQSNAHKSDIYPLEPRIRNSEKVRQLWKLLNEKKLLSDEKYRRLLGTKEFTEEQKADFIARQLVETGQATKGVADILKQVLPSTEIVYSKAGNVSSFRQDRDFIKNRNVNELHHAKDAYLNIVVGNVYLTKFTKSPLNYIKTEYSQKNNSYHLYKMFDYDVERNGEKAWVAAKDGNPGTISTVRKMMSKNTPIVTRQSFVGHGSIANATLYGKNQTKDEGYIPLKISDSKMLDVKKYGGYSSVSTAYFFLVERKVKGKSVRTIETLPIYMKEIVDKDPSQLEQYCVDALGFTEEFSIRVRKINIQSLVKLNGYYVHLSGKTGKQFSLRNAVNLIVDDSWSGYIKLIEKFAESKNISNEITKEKNIEFYEYLSKKLNSTLFLLKPNNIALRVTEGRESFNKLSIEKQVFVLGQILILSSIGTNTADLSLIGGSSSSGKMYLGKDISNKKEIVLVNQSVTGLFESRVNLQTV